MDRELQKAALVAARSTKRQLKEKRIRAFDDDQPTTGSVCSDPSGPVNSCIFFIFPVSPVNSCIFVAVTLSGLCRDRCVCDYELSLLAVVSLCTRAFCTANTHTPV